MRFSHHKARYEEDFIVDYKRDSDAHQEVFHGQTVTVLDKGEPIISIEKVKEMVNRKSDGFWLPEYDEWKQSIQIIPKYFY